jgi:hypothetical protein
VESLAATFQRCAVETRGTAKMWEDLDETGLALLHQNLAVVWQNLYEVERGDDAPAKTPAVVASPNWRRFTPDELQSFRDKVTERRHGYEYPSGCRCEACWTQYRRRAAWPS